MAKEKQENKAKAKQMDIAGFVPTEVKEVREAAEAFSEVKDEFVALTPKLVKAKDALHAAMNKHHVKKCKAGDLLCELIPGEEDVRVKRIRESKEK